MHGRVVKWAGRIGPGFRSGREIIHSPIAAAWTAPAAGVKAGRRPRAAPGLDAGEDDVRLCGGRGMAAGGRWGRGRGQRVVARRVVEADMRGLVTAGPCVRLERCAGSKHERGQDRFGELGLLNSPRGALLLALRFLDSSAPTAGSGGGRFSRASPPATSTSRPVRGRRRRWRSRAVSCAGSG